jgi:DNA-binding transcriptional regulator/RsmH inhibitor MraZ
MLRGIFEEAFSSEGFVALPTRYRSVFTEGAVVMLPLMATHELWIYPLPDAPPARAVRYAAKTVLRLDDHGRILLPRAMHALAVANNLRRLIGAGTCFALRSAEPLGARRRGLNPSFGERSRTVAAG